MQSTQNFSETFLFWAYNYLRSLYNRISPLIKTIYKIIYYHVIEIKF